MWLTKIARDFCTVLVKAGIGVPGILLTVLVCVPWFSIPENPKHQDTIQRPDLSSICFAKISHIGVSENSGTLKSSILIGFSIINHPIWGTPIFGNTHIQVSSCVWKVTYETSHPSYLVTPVTPSMGELRGQVGTVSLMCLEPVCPLFF